MMDEYTVDTFANRNEPVPVIVTGSDPSSDPPKGKRERLKESLTHSSSKLKEKLHETASPSTGNKDYGYSLQDRLFTK